MSDGMTDPVPENIRGEKIEKHLYEHQVNHDVNWGYVMMGVGLLVVGWVLYQRFENSPSVDDEDGDGLSVV